MATWNQDIMDLSDEEFEKLPRFPESKSDVAPVAAVVEKQPPVEEPPVAEEAPVTEAPADDAVVEQLPPVEATPQVEATEVAVTDDDPSDEDLAKMPAPKLVDPAAAKKDTFKGEPDEKLPVAVVLSPSKDESKPAVHETEAADYKSFYERIMNSPIKANGKELKLQSVDEAIQLIQMGANYTKKMQAMQPQKKLLLMLENNGLLNEEKLSFLIDLDKKNPEAIKKLFKDANIDPIDIDTSKVSYRSGAHAVTDQEAFLTSAIEDLNGQDGGHETLQSVNTWDQASKKALWENPELLQVFHNQRVSGIYTQIVNEIERRKTLGQLPQQMPFLSAYKSVGDDLNARGAFQVSAPPASPAPTPGAVRTPVAVRSTGKPPAPKVDDTRVRAAAPTRTTPRAAQVSTNYLAMSDEEFLKQKPPIR